MSTPPSAATPAATATSSSARMSSTIAAPRMMRLARRSSTPRSIRTADVMPTLVATSAAPMNSDVPVVSPSAAPSPIPPAKGITTPSTPTDSAVGPTSRRSLSFVSRPTQKSRKTTPSSAKTSSTSPGSTSPKTAGPTSTPARISPTIVGWRMRRNSSSPTFAASSTTNRSVRMSAMPDVAAMGTRRRLSGCLVYACPTRMPTTATMTPPSVTWISDVRSGTLRNTLRIQAIATSSMLTTT